MNDLPEIPKEVVDATRAVQVWAEKQGAKSWEIMGVCSRNYACAAEGLARQLEITSTIARSHFDYEAPLFLQNKEALSRYNEMKGQ